jgi:hypothetical protein
MKWWKIKLWFGIKRGRTCPTCHADLWRVITCGICGKGGAPYIIGKRVAPPHS